MSCPQIALDCNAIITFDNEPVVMSNSECYLYGTIMNLNFNQQLSGVSIPIIGIDGTNIIVQGNLSENFPTGGSITISDSSDVLLNTFWSPVDFVYDENTDTTSIDIGYASPITEDFGIIAALSCCYALTYTVENTATGEIIDTYTTTNCAEDPGNFVQWFQEQYQVTLNTVGPVKVTIGWETCYGYQECIKELNVCSTTAVVDNCHDHTIHFQVEGDDDIIPPDLTLNVYSIDSDGNQTVVTSQDFISTLTFDYTITVSADGVYYYEIVETDGSRDPVSSGYFIDDCDARACWATILQTEYCIPCSSPCQSGDSDCVEEEKQASILRRNALNVMTSDFWMLLNLTEKLTNQWTTKNPVYLEEYLNDLVRISTVIEHFNTYIKNCAPCS